VTSLKDILDPLATLIPAATQFLAPRVRRTPVEPSPGLSRQFGVPVWLKLENLQLTGSFKVRGAWFWLGQRSSEERRQGVLTCSAGNHGKGLAYAARELSSRVVVCVPNSVEPGRRAAIEALGAEVRIGPCAGYDEAEDWARAEASCEGLPFVSPFDDPAIMAGNGGTLAAEVLNQVPDARNFVLPVGGGGLGAGFAWVVKGALAHARVIACQHQLAPGLARSLATGEAVTRLPAVATIASGIEGGIGRQTFAVLRARVDHVALVDEAGIAAAVRWMLDEHQYLIEPTAAVALAACLSGAVGPLNGPTVVVITGRNVARATAAPLLA